MQFKTGQTRSRRRCWPDYDGLIHVLTYLHRPLDQFGETIPSASEAKQIRAFGFEARAGCKFPCPLLPDVMVRDNPLLECLSNNLDEFWRPRGWNPNRALVLHPVLPSSFSKIEAAILRVLGRAPGCRLAKRTLQQRLWRYPASFINHVIQSLAARGYLQWQGSHILASGLSRPL